MRTEVLKEENSRCLSKKPEGLVAKNSEEEEQDVEDEVRAGNEGQAGGQGCSSDLLVFYAVCTYFGGSSRL